MDVTYLPAKFRSVERASATVHQLQTACNCASDDCYHVPPARQIEQQSFCKTLSACSNEVISKYVQKLQQTAAPTAFTESAPSKAQRPCAASADRFTESELLTAQNCFRVLNAALREEERSSMSWSSVLAMSQARMARMRVWDGVFVTLSLGLMKFHGTQAEQIMGRYLPEIYETIVAATGEGEQVGVAPGAVTSQNAISRIVQPKRVFREMKRLLDGECGHIEIEPVFPGPDNVPLYRQEQCINFHGVIMLLPTSVDLPN